MSAGSPSGTEDRRLFLATAYLFYHYLLRNDTHFLGNRLFLLAMLPVSFLLPLAPLRSPFRTLTFYPALLRDMTARPPATTPASMNFAAGAFVLYCTVAALFTLRILFHLLHLYRLQRRHPRERLQNVTLVRVGSPIPPFSFFNRIFLHAVKNADTLELRQIISHESVHIRQLHSLDILLMELTVALQWFNPFVWLYRKALKETHEYLADREVIAQGFNADGYRLLLFEQQFGAKLFEFASHLKQSQIKRRMFMMNRMEGAVKAPYKIILALPLITLLALALAEPRLIIAQGASADEKKEVMLQEDQKAMSDQERKETLVKLDAKEKRIKEMIAASSDPAEKQKLKETLDGLYKKRQSLMTGHGGDPEGETRGDTQMDNEKLKELQVKLAEKEKYLKELYAGADTPEKKEKIKQDLDMFYKKRQALLQENGVPMKPRREELEKKLQLVHEKRLQIKKLAGEEKDPDKARELKLKFEELGRLEEDLKIKMEKGTEPHS